MLAMVAGMRSLVWLTLNRAYPAKTQARMGAVLSSAWILPSLVGPALAGIIARVWSWRVVFLALLPLVPCALWLILEPLTHIDAQPAPETTSNRTRSAVQLAVGVALLLFGLQQSSLAAIAGFVILGQASTVPCATPNAPVRNAEVAPRTARSTWYPRVADLCILRS